MANLSSIENAFAQLGETGWFSTLHSAVQAELMSSARLLHCERGEHILNIGDPAAGLFGLVSGSCGLLLARDDGQLVPVFRVDPGYWLGDLAVLSGERVLVTIEAVSDVVFVNVPANKVLQMVEQDPGLYKSFYALNRRNMALALRVIAGLTAESSEVRIALRLLLLNDFAESPQSDVTVRQSDLCLHLGLSAPTVQRALKKFSDRNLIDVGYSRIRVLNRLGLLKLAGREEDLVPANNGHSNDSHR